MKIDNETANVLINSKIEGNYLYLPQGQLERKLYLNVNKVLEVLDGKWNRKLKCHIFEESPEEKLESIILTGEYMNAKQEYQFFETPENIALQLIDMAEIEDNETILEPSAGRGAIAKHIKKIDCVELNEKNRKYLIDFNIVGDNFLTFDKKYDVIIANPPFTKQQDIDHVSHMIELANKRVVSIMSSSVMFRTNKKTTEFKDLVESYGGEFMMLPEKSFASSGTNVNTCVVKISK